MTDKLLRPGADPIDVINQVKIKLYSMSTLHSQRSYESFGALAKKQKLRKTIAAQPHEVVL